MSLFLRIVLIVVLVPLVMVAIAYAWLVHRADTRFRGALTEAAEVTFDRAEIGSVEDGIAPLRIIGGGGEEAEGLLRPPPGGGEARVGILLVGGIGTGKNAARLVDPIPGAVVLALD